MRSEGYCSYPVCLSVCYYSSGSMDHFNAKVKVRMHPCFLGFSQFSTHNFSKNALFKSYGMI